MIQQNHQIVEKMYNDNEKTDLDFPVRVSRRTAQIKVKAKSEVEIYRLPHLKYDVPKDTFLYFYDPLDSL